MRIPNYYNEKKYSYATGFIRPKLTALFFDKIWLTDEEADRYGVPSTLRFFIESYEKEFNHKYRRALLQNRNPRETEFTFFKAALHNNAVPIEGEIEEFISKVENEGTLLSDTDISNIKFASELYHKSSYSREEREARFLLTQLKELQDLYAKESFLTSYNRNEVIRFVANKCINRGIELVPIFHDLTDFEKSLLMSGPLNLTEEELSECINYYLAKIPKREVNAIVATIKSIPVIIEDDLSWNQVKDIRRDKKAIRALRRFRTWASQELEGKSQNEIEDILGKELDDYKYALNKHGVLTTVGGFTTVLSMASTIAGAIGANEGSQLQIVAAGFSISAGIITFSAQQLYEYFDTRRQPLAYLYDIVNKKM